MSARSYGGRRLARSRRFGPGRCSTRTPRPWSSAQRSDAKMALQSREAGGQVEGSSARSRLATRGSLFRSERVHGARKRLLLGNARPRLTPSTSACRRRRGSALYDASVSPIDADDPARLPEGARLAVEPGRKRLTRCLRPGRAWDRRACQRKVARPTSSPTAQRLLEAPRGPGRLIPRPVHRSRVSGVALPRPL